MKKLNSKGFTLIELLAVITIMGILMLVAIPTVSRTIENSRKDTFLDTTNQYVNGVKNMWAADTLSCDSTPDATGGEYVSSAVPTGWYYVPINTADTTGSLPTILEQGGKSSWGSRHMKGFVLVKVEDDEIGTGSSAKITRKVSYYPVLVDGVHGINVDTSVSPAEVLLAPVASEELKRSNLVMSGAAYTILADASDKIMQPIVEDASGTEVKAGICVEQ